MDIQEKAEQFANLVKNEIEIAYQLGLRDGLKRAIEITSPDEKK